jgi:hypothetical protein
MTDWYSEVGAEGGIGRERNWIRNDELPARSRISHLSLDPVPVKCPQGGGLLLN